VLNNTVLESSPLNRERSSGPVELTPGLIYPPLVVIKLDSSPALSEDVLKSPTLSLADIETQLTRSTSAD
jgi:hypothetical protein